eukprot:scaffold38894_cov71-Phaeocystis_antarctica.AAC.1
MGGSPPANFTGNPKTANTKNWAVQITVVTQLLEDCGEALSRPKLLRDTLLVLRHTVEALKLVQFTRRRVFRPEGLKGICDSGCCCPWCLGPGAGQVARIVLGRKLLVRKMKVRSKVVGAKDETPRHP